MTDFFAAVWASSRSTSELWLPEAPGLRRGATREFLERRMERAGLWRTESCSEAGSDFIRWLPEAPGDSG